MHKKDHETWWRRHVIEITEKVRYGTYWVSAEDIADAMIYGRPKWGDDPVFLDESDEESAMAG